MSLRRQVVRGAITLGIGQAGAHALGFVRNVILARLLTQADFGVAATFAMTVALMEMASNMAADKLLVQSKDGEHERLQGVIHLFEASRGVLMGVLLLAAAGPIAHLFGVPEAAWSFRVLALAPVIRGFRHLDVVRAQRGMRFAPMVVMETSTQAVTVAAAWPLAAWLGDYTAMLWLVLLREVMLSAMSHAMAERKYRWGWDRRFASSVLVFGWPLLMNGMLYFAAVQGDRVIVGATYGMEELGLYAAAVYLTLAPVMAVAKMHSSLALPALSQAQDRPSSFVARHRASAWGLGLVAASSAIALILFGEAIMSAIYGERYRGGGFVLAWLGAATAIRMLRAAPSTAAMALGDTKNPMYANAFRLIGVGVALGAALAGAPLWTVAAAGLLGEVIGMAAAVRGLSRRHGVSVWCSLEPALVVIALAASAMAALILDVGPVARGIVLAALLAALFGAAWRRSGLHVMLLRRPAPVARSAEFAGSGS